MRLIVGGNVDCWCTRCKMVLAHTIEAIVDGEPRRVACNTCHSKHNFKALAPHEKISIPKVTRVASERPNVLTKSSAKKSVVGVAKASHYAALMLNRDTALTRSYSLREHFDTGDLVSHTLFGLGLVTGDKGAHKIEVLFPEGPKVLVHGR